MPEIMSDSMSPEPIQPAPQKHGIVERASQLLNRNVLQPVATRNEELGYDSNAGTYGFTLTRTDDGKFVFTSNGLWNKIDRTGDRIIRRADEHVIQKPLEMFKKHPRRFFHQVATGAKRARAETDVIAKNAERLGLSDYYGPYPEGIELKKPELFTKGVNLWDIYSVDNPALQQIDRMAALTTAGAYIRSVHDNYGAIGEVLPNDIIFQKVEGRNVSEPVLNLPDIVYDAKKYSPEQVRSATEPRAVDLMDFLMSVGASEIQKTGSWEAVEQAVDAIIKGYGDSKVIPAAASLAQRGRLVLTGKLFSQHNKVRLSMGESDTAKLRQLIITECSGNTSFS